MWSLIAVCLVIGLANCEPIDSLPGSESFSINFKHYSGFFKVSDTHFLHYWFVESQGDPVKDPLIFWFNGGPGCSSLDGLLNELGPYNVNPDGKTLHANENSWNKLASIVFIESPAGVGFSYSADGNITTNDDQTADENYIAVKSFYKEFPQFSNHSTFIMGESYGGVYVPTLTARIVDGMDEFPINLKGMALGNGYVDEVMNVDTSVRFAYGHGIIDEKTWNTLEVECCHGCADSCDFTRVQGHCARMVEDIFKFLWFGGLNPYDLYRDCDPSPDYGSSRMTVMRAGLLPRRFLARDNVKYRKNDVLQFIRHNGGAPCLNDTDMQMYMNDVEVKQALHIPFNLPRWEICSDKVTTTYQKQYGNMAPFVKKIIASGVRVLLYYGDVDMACNFMMGQQFAASLKLKRLLNKTPYKYNGQIAGFKTIYKGLQFVTIRGAGHMAPQWRAPQNYYVIQQFLLNHPI